MMVSIYVGVIGVVCAFCLVIVGVDGVVGLLGTVILLIFSAFVGFIAESADASKRKCDEFKILQFKAKTSSIPQSLEDVRDFRLDRRLTGSSLIDDALQEILQYILRDYIEVWHSKITNDVEFLFDVRQVMQKIIISISNRCKEVEWLPFLTTRLVDSVATHIRIYREARSKCRGKQQNGDSQSRNTQKELENTFFEIELALEKNKMCRRKICVNSDYEKECLKMITDFLLLLVGPNEEVGCRPVQLLSSQIISSVVFLPLLNLLSDPDYINQVIIWLCKGFPATSETFLTVLRYTENAGELESSREMLNREVALLRSHDLGGEDDILIKQQLSSLLYVKKIIEHRLLKLQEGSDNDSALSIQVDWNRILANQGNRLYQLPLDVILKNNVALSYFLDFMSSIDSQAYLFFLLNAEGWKIAAEQQIASMKAEGFHIESGNKKTNPISEDNPFHQILANMREASMSLYEQYLSEKAFPRLRIDEIVVRRLLFNIKNETPAATWFDESQLAIMDKLQKDDKFMPSFRKSVGYVRLLAELDLLKDISKSDEEETRSLDELSLGESSSLCSFDVDDRDKNYNSPSEVGASSNVSDAPVRNSECTLTASICQKGVIKDGLSSHAVYAVTVTKSHEGREMDSWIVYRRYSDFYDFHQRMEARFKSMGELSFPAKRTFNNMDKLFLERRQFLLNEYLRKLLHPEFLGANPGLQGELLHFLDRGSYEHSKGAISRKVDSLVNPLVTSVRTVTKAVRWMPNNLFKANVRPNENEDLNSLSAISGIDLEGDDNVPLRILLFLMDEVFDLRNRNQWLRRRIFYMLREILRAMYGDVFNQRIVDSVEALTSADHVAEYIRTIKNSLWPNGTPAMPRPPRDDATRMRTRVAAKMGLLSCISDEMKHLIGSETTRQGVLRVFELFQNPCLNRRLAYVVLENLVHELFPQHSVPEFFMKMHSVSNR